MNLIEEIKQLVATGTKLVFESYENEISRVWLYYDPATSSIILVRRTYDKDRKRSFNHIIFDDFWLEDNSSQEIEFFFQEARKKIEEGKCWRLELINKQYQFKVIE